MICKVCQNEYDEASASSCPECGAPSNISKEEAIDAAYIMSDGGAPSFAAPKKE